jgi:hypothetical protein
MIEPFTRIRRSPGDVEPHRAGQEEPPCVTAPIPRTTRFSFENDVARFLRVRYGQGERSVMHRHLPGCVIFLTEQTLTFDFMVPDDTGGPASVPAGALGCSDGTVHLPENIGEETAELITVELEDRAAFQK